MGGCASLCSSSIHTVPSSVMRRECYNQLKSTCSTGSVGKESCVSTSTFKIRHIKSLDDISSYSSSTTTCWENLNLLSSRSNQSVLVTSEGVPVVVLSSLRPSSPTTVNVAKPVTIPPINIPIKKKPSKSTIKPPPPPIAEKSRKDVHVPFILVHASSSNKLKSPNCLPSMNYDYLVPGNKKV